MWVIRDPFYTTDHELDGSGAAVPFSHTAVSHSLCDAALVAGTCGTGSTGHVTLETTTVERGTSMTPRSFGSVWGEVGIRTLSGVVQSSGNQIEYQNSTGYDWRIGFPLRIDESIADRTISTLMTPDGASRPKPASRTRNAGSAYEIHEVASLVASLGHPQEDRHSWTPAR